MKCYLCKDLLSLYCDGLLSEESTQAVQAHLQTCADCRTLHEAMESRTDGILPEAHTSADPLRKVRRRNALHVLLGILGTAAACGLVFLFVFWGVIPITEDRCHYTVTAAESEGRPTLDFLFDTDCACIHDRTTCTLHPAADGTSLLTETHLWLYPVVRLPFDDRGEHPDQFELGIMAREGDILTIHYLGKTITLDAAALYESLTAEEPAAE